MAGAYKTIHRGLGVLLVLLAAMAVAVAIGARDLAAAYRRVDASQRLLRELEATLQHAVSIQSGVRGFSLTGDERYLAPYDSGLVAIQHSIVRLRTLTADDPTQVAAVRRLAGLVDEEVAVMQQRLAARRSGGLPAVSALSADGRGKRVMDAIRGAVGAMRTQAKKELDRRIQTLNTKSRWLGGGLFAALAVTAGVIAWLGRLARRVGTAETAARPAETVS